MDITLETERKVLSVMMHDEGSCIDAFTRLGIDDFYYGPHQTLFDIMSRIYSKGKKITYVVVLNECHKQKVFDESFGHLDLKWIADHYVPGKSGSYFVDEQLKLSKTIKLERLLDHYKAVIEDGKLDINSDLADIMGEITGIYSTGEAEIDTARELAVLARSMLEESMKRYNASKMLGKPILDGLPTGLSKLDDITLGYGPGNLILLAAETGKGKTAFALHTAITIAVENGQGLLYINTEMERGAVMRRMISTISGVEHGKIRQGDIEAETEIWEAAVRKIEGSPFYHYHAPKLTPIKCAMIARQAVMKYDVKMIIVDYIGRMEKYNPQQSEWQVLEQIVKSQKLIAQELGIPVMIIAQLNSDGTLQGAKRIKNECDIMLKLLPLDAEEREKAGGKFVNANYRLQIDKNRDGQSGLSIILHYDKAIQRIELAEEMNTTSWSGYGQVKDDV